MEKSQILQQGLKQLNDYTRNALKLSAEEDYFEVETAVDSAAVSGFDAVSIRSPAQPDSRYIGFVQPWAPQKDINALITQMRSMPSGAILFANFVNPVMAEKFRRRSISFVDCAGNLSIKNKKFDFYVKRKKLPRLRNKRIRGRAFNSAGLKLIFALFTRPELLNATHREISSQVKIALGSVGPVMDDLFNSGYILEEGPRRLVNKKRLFERWVDGYLEKLRPRQIIACYRSEHDDWWQQAEPAPFDGQWGGEVIIAKSTPFMVPETVSLYFSSPENSQLFAERYGLVKDDEGDICIYRSFWTGIVDTAEQISPMVMYADIVDSINPGSWDVAKTFYGEAVADLLID